MFKKIRKMLKDNKGLTLVELLAVIVILGIISAIAVPSIGGIINKTKDDAKVAEALQIINAAKMAHASNGLPTAADGTHSGWGNTELSPYLDSVDDAGATASADPDYLVKYDKTNDIYTIDNHDAEGIVDDSSASIIDTNADGLLSEEELLAYTGN